MIDAIDPSAVPPAAVVAVAALLAPFLSRRSGYALGALALAAVAGWALVVPEGVGATATFLGFEVLLVAVDDVTRLVALIFGGFGIGAVAYAYFAGADRIHLAVALGYVAAAVWTVSVGDWLGLVIGWELMAVASTLLVWLHGGAAVRAGYRYALAHALGGGLLLSGVAAHLATVGIAPDALHFDGTGVAAGVPTLAVGLGVGLNAAVIGLHGWLPDTYHRPHVAASVFLCAYTTKAAVYAAYRTFPEGNLVLAYAGGAMAVYGAAYALAQKDMRRLLAYHIQAQVGYMLAGIGVGSALGVAGGFAHLFNNVLYKGLLFMVAGIVVLRTGENRLDRFGALGTTAPVVLAAFLVAALSITAVPGFNGFVSKGMVLDAAAAAGAEPLRWLLLAGAVGTFASFLKFGYYAFLEGDPVTVRDASAGHAAVVLPIAGLCVVLGLSYDALFAVLPATEAWSTDPYSRSHVLEGVALAAAGLAAFVLGKPAFDRLHGGVDVDRIHDPAVFYGTRAISEGVARTYRAVDDLTAGVGWASARAVRDPVRTIRSHLPASHRDWYDRRRDRTPGRTGLKAGISTSVYVVIVLLAITLAVAHL